MSLWSRLFPKPLTEEAIIQAEEEVEFTPDVAYLQDRVHANLFVCDQLQQRFPQNDLLRGKAMYRGTAFTVRDDFRLYRHRQDPSLVIPIEHAKKYPAKIKGEVFTLDDPAVLFALDIMRQNGYHYNRKRIKLRMEYSMNTEHGVIAMDPFHFTAWMYVAVTDYWFLNSFQPVTLFERPVHGAGLFYAYTDRELKHSK